MGKRESCGRRWALIGVGVVVGLWALSWLLTVILLDKPAERAFWGDSFGAVSALFSGLAFLAVAYAIWLQRQDIALQREDLELQRQELALTRDELKRTADAQERSQEVLLRQAEHLDRAAKIGGLTTLLADLKHRFDKLERTAVKGSPSEIDKDLVCRARDDLLQELAELVGHGGEWRGLPRRGS